MRASELRGLRWKDVDLKKNELHVRQRADRYNTIGVPKSESGERTVPFPPIVSNCLREWKLACPRNDLDLVFPTSRGNIEHHKNIVRFGLIPALTRAGLKTRYGFHSLRHFYASWSINRKIDGGLELPVKVLQERLGDSSITMTADRYGHLFPRGDDAADLAHAERSLLG